MSNDDLITQRVQSFIGGNRADAEELARLIAPTLERMALGVLRTERSEAWLRRTDLVNELWVQLSSRNWTVKSRKHLWCIAARFMRHHLVDAARKRKAGKRGGDVIFVPFNELIPPGDSQLSGNSIDVVRINDLLEELEIEKPDAVRVIELRCFLELTWEEIVKETGLTLRQARGRYQYGLDWLKDRLG